jgi:hypothetical protein
VVGTSQDGVTYSDPCAPPSHHSNNRCQLLVNTRCTRLPVVSGSRATQAASQLQSGGRQTQPAARPYKHRFKAELAHPNVLAQRTASVRQRQHMQLRHSPRNECCFTAAMHLCAATSTARRATDHSWPHERQHQVQLSAWHLHRAATTTCPRGAASCAAPERSSKGTAAAAPARSPASCCCGREWVGG